ncbi:hypothetical protein QLX08_007548 [Tetragonisca angustula]|uniref:Uncharacterized protein n=1 Tax=Tetragonisca angustula TaxID=166442 RepID=A0AAW0ZPW5_9HYME
MNRPRGHKGTIFVSMIVDQPGTAEVDKFWHVAPRKRQILALDNERGGETFDFPWELTVLITIARFQVDVKLIEM